MQISYLSIPLIQKPKKPFAEIFGVGSVCGAWSRRLCIENIVLYIRHVYQKPLVVGVLCIKYPINWGECSSDGRKAIKTVNKCFICRSTVGCARGARHACDLKATWKRHQRTLPSFERAENPTECIPIWIRSFRIENPMCCARPRTQPANEI